VVCDVPAAKEFAAFRGYGITADDPVRVEDFLAEVSTRRRGVGNSATAF
jgi:hypothetical protein